MLGICPDKVLLSTSESFSFPGGVNRSSEELRVRNGLCGFYYVNCMHFFLLPAFFDSLSLSLYSYIKHTF
jgi:hypothetical protein